MPHRIASWGRCRAQTGRTIDMLDHTGQRRVRYADAFRALGNYLDAEQFTQISIVETPEGFLVKGFIISEITGGYHVVPTTYLFANEDIDSLLEAAYDRRGKKRER
jgi:hypothetical protein